MFLKIAPALIVALTLYALSIGPVIGQQSIERVAVRVLQGGIYSPAPRLTYHFFLV